MRSERPKVLHPLGGRPLVVHAVCAAAEATGSLPLVVVSPGDDAVRAVLDGDARCVEQAAPGGTGDALRSVPEELRSAGDVLVTYGDCPLLRPQTLRRLLELHRRRGLRCSLLAVEASDPRGLGRVVRDARGDATAVIEDRDLASDAVAPTLCNAGVYVFAGEALWPALEAVGTDNAQGERYLTDVVAALAPAAVLVTEDRDETIGVNDRRDLAAAEAVLRRRTLDALMVDGVTIEDPATTFVDAAVEVGRDTVLRPMTVLRGATRLGAGCEVGPMAQLRDVLAGDRVRIGAASLEECALADEVVIGQYARVRPGTTLRRGVFLGTHAEVKNSDVGAHTQISHFSCLLDSDVGERVNFSAGAVTCNYDGDAKHRIVIEDSVFVGSGVMLVAPLRIGRGAYLAAGSVITKDVPAGALAVARGEQRNVLGWVERRRLARQAEPA